jgi:hypothetical protein
MEIDYATNKAFKAEGWLKVVFVITTLLYLPIANYKYLQLAIAFGICVLGINRQVQTLTLSKETAAKIFLGEFGNALIYILFLLSVDEPSMAFYLPLDLYFMIGISEFVTRSKPQLLTRFEQVAQASEVIKTHKDLIKVARTFCEVFLFVYVVALVIMGHIGFFSALLAFNYLKIKGVSPIGRWTLLEMQKEIVAKVQRVPMIAKVFGVFFGLLTQ